jgi:hypothetical protein
MRRHEAGPRRSQSIDALARSTRVLAGIALLALVGAIVSDLAGTDFWARHALLAGLVASVIVVMLSVAVINEVLERRRRERWSILAQYVMLELVRNARLIWTGVLARVGLLATERALPDSIDENARTVRDTAGLTVAVSASISDEDRRRELRDEVALLSAHADEMLGRWAAVMLNAEIYAEVIDRHVELASDIAWLLGMLDTADPPDDHRRHRRAASSPAVQIEGAIAGDELARRIVVIAQLAEELDRTTLELALRVVPVEWWQVRLGSTVPLDRRRGVARIDG